MNQNPPPDDGFSSPAFARGRNDDRCNTELRVDIPKAVMGVIDAAWMSRGGAKASRNSVVNEILQEWAEKKWHEASLVLQLVPGNPAPAESKDAGGLSA